MREHQTLRPPKLFASFFSFDAANLEDSVIWLELYGSVCKKALEQIVQRNLIHSTPNISNNRKSPSRTRMGVYIVYSYRAVQSYIAFRNFSLKRKWKSNVRRDSMI